MENEFSALQSVRKTRIVWKMGVFRTLCSVEKYFQNGKAWRKLSKNAGNVSILHGQKGRIGFSSPKEDKNFPHFCLVCSTLCHSGNTFPHCKVCGKLPFSTLFLFSALFAVRKIHFPHTFRDCPQILLLNFFMLLRKSYNYFQDY